MVFFRCIILPRYARMMSCQSRRDSRPHTLCPVTISLLSSYLSPCRSAFRTREVGSGGFSQMCRSPREDVAIWEVIAFRLPLVPLKRQRFHLSTVVRIRVCAEYTPAPSTWTILLFPFVVLVSSCSSAKFAVVSSYCCPFLPCTVVWPPLCPSASTYRHSSER